MRTKKSYFWCGVEDKLNIFMNPENIKVLTIHGFNGMPNKGWHPWLMIELRKQKIYCASLVMKNPSTPKASEWVNEIDYNIKKFPKDKIILVGHSLGVPAILKYLEKANSKNILGCVLVSGPYKDDRKGKVAQILKSFFVNGFKFENIKKKAKHFTVIHGTDDSVVHFSHAEFLSKTLEGKLIAIKNGGHLNSSAGWYKLPYALKAILEIIK